MRALVRDPSRLQVAGVEAFPGDVLEPATLTSAVAGCQACVHLVGILREDPDQGVTFDRLHYQATRNVLAACLQAEVGRFLHMSANGAERALPMPYFVSKLRAEQAVRSSRLPSVIMRPSMIFGGARDRQGFVEMIEEVFNWSPGLPYFPGKGFRLAPVSAREVAFAFGAALVRPEAVGQAYHLCGPEVYAYKELLKLIRDLGGHKGFLFPLPYGVAHFLSRFKGFPVTGDMLEMLKAGNTCPEDQPDFHDLLEVPRQTLKQWLIDRKEAREADPAEALMRARPTRELYIPRIEDFPPGELPGSGENPS